MGMPNAPCVRRKVLVGGVEGLELCQVGTQVIKKKKAKCHGKCQFKFGPKFSCDIHAYKSRA